MLVTLKVAIARPVSDVATWAANPENATQWYTRITSAQWKSEPPLALGSRIAFEAAFMGKKMSYTYEVTAYEPGRRLVMEAFDGPFPMKTVYEWEEAEDGTVMTLSNSGSPRGPAWFMQPMMSLMMRRQMKKDLALLKGILEK